MRKDDVTAELPGVTRRRGRPSTGKAMTDAERQKAYRKRLKDQGRVELKCIISQDVADALKKHVRYKDMPLGEAIDKFVRDRLLRKR